ncbi:hypothetical protein ACJIZ3_007199 [Penstemon smallii]|uniref:Cytochrome P450 n=1 Tax=Penstemon smallii TaxID=265156 RepID=A0ABD3S9X8_9LAMI
MDMSLISSVLTSFLVIASITFAVKVLNWIWFSPKKLEKILRKQGLNGNPYRLLVGDMNDLIGVVKSEQSKSIQLFDNLSSHVMPYFHQIIQRHGQNPFTWFGPSPRLIITDPRIIREILTKPELFHKTLPDPIGETIAGGLLYLEDEKWTKHRKLINPAFHLQKLKNMTMAIQLSCSNMIDKWEALLVSSNNGNPPEIDVWPYFEDLSGDVISRVGFGSSHEQGRRIFELQKEQVKLVLQIMQFFFIPGFRHIPTKSNRRMKSISKEIQSLLKGLINQRDKEMEREEAVNDDLLGILLDSNIREIQEHGNKNMGMSIEDVIEECKLFYFAGSETTSSLLVWTMVMLSIHQDWQTRAREDVLQFFGKNEPTFDGLNRLQIVTMILHEVLRLYTPIPMIARSPIKRVKVGNLILPVGVHVLLLIGLLHHDPIIWGEDVNEFKPERFSEGISNATKVQFSFIPFSSGPRICIGQHLAMIEVKIALAMILQKFSFELSPSYLHAPFSIITIQPKYGAPLLFHKLKQGLNGNPYRLLLGDMNDLIKVMKSEQSKSIQFSDDLPSHIMPYYQQIIHKYGENSFIWFGPSPRLNIIDPQMIKEILSKPELFHKPLPDPIGETILGGLSYLEDEKWAKHRRLINPAFHLEKLKNMTRAIRLSCSNLTDKWEALVISSNKGNPQEIDVWPYFEDLSGDMISQVGFGSSHEQGRRIFELQKEQVKLVLQLMQFFFIPGFRHIPTKSNRRMNSISKEIQYVLTGLINQREKEMERGEAINDDLLGILLESNTREIQEHGNKNMGMSIEEVIEECKLFYFAGSETTSSLLLWTMVMLSKHQDWQTRAREEVLQFFGKNEPTFDGLNRLKIVTMILHEVLRLYTPAPLILRSPTKKVKVGNLTLPVGVHVLLQIGLLHHDQKIWGEDVNEFKPERFSEGISNATKLENFLRKQGLDGNPYRLLLGDMSDLIKVIKSEQSKSIQFSDDLPSHIMPYYQQIIHKYVASNNGKPQEIDVWPYFEDLSGDMISQVGFGSSHEQGRRIFELQKEQAKLTYSDQVKQKNEINL